MFQLFEGLMTSSRRQELLRRPGQMPSPTRLQDVHTTSQTIIKAHGRILVNGDVYGRRLKQFIPKKQNAKMVNQSEQSRCSIFFTIHAKQLSSFLRRNTYIDTSVACCVEHTSAITQLDVRQGKGRNTSLLSGLT